MLPWMVTSSLCLGYWFNISFFHIFCSHGSIFYLLRRMLYHIVDVTFVCTDFACFIPKPYCWFLFGMFVYLFHLRSLHIWLSFRCRIQFFYCITFSLWSSKIESCWLCITNFIHSWNLNMFLVFLNWHIFYLIDWIVIIT